MSLLLYSIEQARSEWAGITQGHDDQETWFTGEALWSPAATEDFFLPSLLPSFLPSFLPSHAARLVGS